MTSADQINGWLQDAGNGPTEPSTEDERQYGLEQQADFRAGLLGCPPCYAALREVCPCSSCSQHRGEQASELAAERFWEEGPAHLQHYYWAEEEVERRRTGPLTGL